MEAERKIPEHLHARIAQRAYELWEARGCPPSDGAEDWRNAEKQIMGEEQNVRGRGPLLRLFDRMRKKAA